MTVPGEWAGGRTRCPDCRAPLEIPRRPAALADARPAPGPRPPLEVDPFAPPKADLLVERSRPTGALPGDAARRELPSEQHTRAIAFWHLLSGGLVLALGLAALAFLGGRLGATAAGLSLGVGGASLALGVGLWSYQSWARVLTIGSNGLSVFITLWGVVQGEGRAMSLIMPAAVVLFLLSGSAATIHTEGYRGLVRRTPGVRVRFWRSPFFWAPVLVLALIAGAGLIGAGALASLR